MTAFDTTICPLSGGKVRSLLQELAADIEPAQAAWAPPDRMAVIEVPADRDREPCARASARLLGDLEAHALEPDGIVLADNTELLMAEDLVEVGAAGEDEGGGRIARRHGKLIVV